MNEVAVAKTQPELSLDIIKKYVCPKATDQEAYTFCNYVNLKTSIRF